MKSKTVVLVVLVCAIYNCDAPLWRDALQRAASAAIPPPSLGGGGGYIGRTHPSRDVIFLAKSTQKQPEIVTSHDGLEPLKQALLAPRDVTISSQICGSNTQRVFHIR